jgi:hypothetical protein
MADDKSQKDFTVVDKRVGVDGEESAEGSGVGEEKGEEKKADVAPEAQDESTEEDANEAPANDPAPGPEADGGESEPPQEKSAPPPPPPVTFPTFLLSLHTAALIHLGLIPDPVSNEQVVNLGLARQNIDLLEMLQKKTKGNLDDEESKLFDNILYELRMVYVQVCEQTTGGECKS